MQVFLQSVVSGVLVGGVYALIGIGLTLIFGVMRVINFAHGELLMVGMYLTYYVFTLLGIDPFVSIVIVIPVMFLFGVLLQRVLIQRVLDALPQNQILLTIGLGLILSNTVMLVFTSVITGALYLFLLETDVGQAIRATAQDREAAQLMGVNVRRMGLLAFGLGSALAGTAGALVSPTYYIFPQVGSAFTLTAFVIVVLGGMGSIIGATLGGIIIGTVESLAASYVSSGVKELFVYLLFLFVLLVKPSGLLGKSRL